VGARIIKSFSTIAGLLTVGGVAITIVLIALTMLGGLLRFVMLLWDPLMRLLGL